MKTVKCFEAAGGQYYKSTTEVTALSIVALQPFNVLEFITFAEFDLQQNKTYLTYHILNQNLPFMYFHIFLINFLH